MIVSPNLSIVLITRNEENNIARAIESVITAVQPYPETEIMLVDSASTDRTVEIAQKYPISIVRLDPSWFLSAAAGRYIGTYFTQGDLLLYMDGDMELRQEWLKQALLLILGDDDIAGITGHIQDVYVQNGLIQDNIENDPDNKPAVVKHFGGLGLYKRSALNKVGGFNPFFSSEEEPELCIRLRCAGFKLLSLPLLAARHYCIPQNSITGQIRRVRLRLFLGYGQIPRYHLGTRLFWVYLIERGSFIVYLVGILLTFITLLVTLLTKNIVYFGGWVLTVSIFFLIYLVKKRSLRRFMQSLLNRTLAVFGAVSGFIKSPRSPDEYPLNAEVVQIGYHRSSLDSKIKRTR